MPWHRSTGSFVRAASWQIFGRIGLPARVNLGLTCPRSIGHHSDESASKVSSTRPQKVYANIVPQPER
jgi:hypothetical protein